ncbi:MAG: transglycosylase domain-containing protein [Anaerolineales bacterium]|nr:transglycosylase domain-containing protein [Anaerolineales bacterium]
MNQDESDRERLQRLLRSEEETRNDLDPAPPDSTQVFRKPMGGTTPLIRNLPELDENNMPLPNRVDETDLEGTRVSSAAYRRSIDLTPTQPPPSAQRPAYRLPYSQGQPPPQRPSAPKAKPSFVERFRGKKGCFVRGLVVSIFAFALIALCGSSIFVYQYYKIASTLPDVGDLKNHASQFQTTRILDRNGRVLYELNDPTAGRRTYIPLSQISPNLVAATIATEDKDFYDNPGFDPVAIVRALWRNYKTDGQGGGASTITQQLARALLLSPEERAQRTVSRKSREIILAAEITRRYSKDEILELYLNEIYYGNLAYGAEAAANTYFNKSAKDLTVGEAAFLAGLPQSPAVYDIYTNSQPTLTRQQQVLVLMFDLSRTKNCIEVGEGVKRVCVDAVVATQAANEIKAYNFIAPVFGAARYPHWVNFIRSELESMFDAQTIYRSGFTVYTTLDPVLQDRAQELVSNQIAAMTENNAKNGALVAIQPSTGQILAMIGSPDFNNAAISGQVNMALSPTRQPGSSIKPLTYVAAFEKGWTPATWIWDVPTQFPDGANPPYEPRNYDGAFHGGVTVRTALANSFNIPAVKTLEFIGIYDDPNTPQKDGLIGMAERLGITSLTRNDYGLALTLGGGDVSLMEMTGAFSVFANGGKKLPPVAILKITTNDGKIVYQYEQPKGEQVIRPEHAYLITSILSDNEARNFTFGRHSALNLSFPVAAKTGTTNDFRDNWTMGYNPDLTVGVWVGNADYTPMVNTTGLSGAAPIWSQFMEFAVPYLTNGAPTQFSRPQGIVDRIVCNLGGTEPTNQCGGEHNEVFAADQLPLPKEQGLIRRMKLDKWTGYEASDACKGPTDEKLVINVKDVWALKWFKTDAGKFWLTDNGLDKDLDLLPERACKKDDPQPEIEINFADGQPVLESLVEIKGTAASSGNFKEWRLEFGVGEKPDSWKKLAESDQQVKDATLVEWDVSDLPSGIITLRLTLIGEKAEVQKKIRINLIAPTPTLPTETPTGTPTLIPTETPLIIPPTNTPAPILTDTPLVIPPTETPTPIPPPSPTP